MTYWNLVERLQWYFENAIKYNEYNCIWSMYVDCANKLCHEYEKYLSKKDIAYAVMTARDLANSTI